jgi:hypothetical protein
MNHVLKLKYQTGSKWFTAHDILQSSGHLKLNSLNLFSGTMIPKLPPEQVKIV